MQVEVVTSRNGGGSCTAVLVVVVTIICISDILYCTPVLLPQVAPAPQPVVIVQPRAPQPPDFHEVKVVFLCIICTPLLGLGEFLKTTLNYINIHICT